MWRAATVFVDRNDYCLTHELHKGGFTDSHRSYLLDGIALLLASSSLFYGRHFFLILGADSIFSLRSDFSLSRFWLISLSVSTIVLGLALIFSRWLCCKGVLNRGAMCYCALTIMYMAGIFIVSVRELAAYYIFAIATGIATAWFFVAFMEAMARLTLRNAVLLWIMQTIGALLCYFVLCAMPTSSILLLALAIITSLSVFTLFAWKERAKDLSASEITEPDDPSTEFKGRSTVLFVLSFLALAGIAYGLIKLNSLVDLNPASTTFIAEITGMGASALLLLAYVRMYDRVSFQEFLLTASALFMALAFAFIPIAIDSFRLSMALFQAGFAVASCFAWTLGSRLLRTGHAQDLQSYRISLLVLLSHLLGQVIGSFALASPLFQQSSILSWSSLVAFVLLASAVVAEAVNKSKGTDADALRLDDSAIRIEELIKESGLTPRESDVFRLIAENKSPEEIQETLFLSANTVKTHTRHIFRKLDIHSRKELFAKLKD